MYEKPGEPSFLARGFCKKEVSVDRDLGGDEDEDVSDFYCFLSLSLRGVEGRDGVTRCLFEGETRSVTSGEEEKKNGAKETNARGAFFFLKARL